MRSLITAILCGFVVCAVESNAALQNTTCAQADAATPLAAARVGTGTSTSTSTTCGITLGGLPRRCEASPRVANGSVPN